MISINDLSSFYQQYAVQQLHQAMQKSGITTSALIPADGKLHRFHVAGDRPRSRNGWAILFSNPPKGAFGCWKRDIREKWCAADFDSLSQYRKSHKVRSSAQRRWESERECSPPDCFEEAWKIWNSAYQAKPQHPYLRSKGIKAYGIRQYNGQLLVPVFSIDGEFKGLQKIFPDGQKYFQKGTQKNGNFFQIGTLSTVVFICEGYATGVTVHEATGEAVVVAFDTGNLPVVATSLRRKFPQIHIIICADNDRWSVGNPGIASGREAALSVEGDLIYPVFINTTTSPTDFNDLAQLEGIEAVRIQLAEVL